MPEVGDRDLAATMITRQTHLGSEVSADRASVPLMLLTANQPMPAVTALSPAGRMLPQYPKGIRDWIICGTPNSGPRTPSSAVRQRAQRRAEHDGEHRLRERQPEGRDREHADEHGGVFEVGRRPGPEQRQRAAVPLVERDELGAAGLDGDDAVAVLALADLSSDRSREPASVLTRPRRRREGRGRMHGALAGARTVAAPERVGTGRAFHPCQLSGHPAGRMEPCPNPWSRCWPGCGRCSPTPRPSCGPSRPAGAAARAPS